MKIRVKKSVTLAELMIAIAFIAVALASIMGLFIACSKLNSQSRNMTRAVTHLEYVLEQVKGESSLNNLKNKIDNGNWNWVVDDVTSQGLQSLSNENISVCCYDSGSDSCLANCPDQDFLDIFAQVQWKSREGRDISFSLRTLVTEYE
ncbi:MAG: hypothetical protein R6U54_03350 [Candidatus Omnitrophota bacterium]